MTLPEFAAPTIYISAILKGKLLLKKNPTMVSAVIAIQTVNGHFLPFLSARSGTIKMVVAQPAKYILPSKATLNPGWQYKLSGSTQLCKLVLLV